MNISMTFQRGPAPGGSEVVSPIMRGPAPGGSEVV